MFAVVLERIWKKYQVFTPTAERLLDNLKEKIK